MGYKPEAEEMATNPTVRYRTANVNGLSATSQPLLSTVSGKGNFVVTALRAVPKTITGAPLGTLLATVGTNSSSYNNVATGLSLAAGTVDVAQLLTASLVGATIPAGTGLYLKVGTAFTAASAYLFDVYVEGYYEN